MNAPCELGLGLGWCCFQSRQFAKTWPGNRSFFSFSCVSVSLLLCFPSPPQNLCGSCHCAVRPPAAGWRAVIAVRIRRVPFIMWSLYLRVQAAIQHLRGAAGPSTLRPAQGRSCRLEKGTRVTSWSGFLFLEMHTHCGLRFPSEFETKERQEKKVFSEGMFHH